jgi:predicted MFS family arabinose efflux permease
MPPILNLITLATFASSLSSRSIEPVLPMVAGDFGVSMVAAAQLAAAVALPYALVQPVLGAVADVFGKSRLMIFCLALLGLANIMGALSTSFHMLFISRILCGAAGGGTMPVAMGLISDLVPTNQRQVALGRILGGAMTGNLLGSTAAGFIGDYLGWRGVLGVLGVLMIVAAIAVAVGLRRSETFQDSPRSDFATLKRGYLAILRNPNARVCYTSVFIEGIFVLGVIPFIAAFLFEMGETQSSIPGIVIAAFAVGGVIYTLSVPLMLKWVGVKGLMIGGAAVVAMQLAVIAESPHWQIQAFSFLLMGWAFYSLHGSFQVFASDLAPEARASSLSLHSCSFFLGQAVGPIAYGFGLSHLGKMPTLWISAAVILILGIVAARLLNPRRPELTDI